MDETDSATALEVLKRDYQETLVELTGPKAQIIEPFRVEYENLYKALLRSHESENRLTKKIRDLSAEISASSQSVQVAMKTAAEDQQQIITLRRDIEAQQKLVEQSLQKEQQSNEIIAKHKSDIADLVRRIEQGAGMSAEQENQLAQLKTRKEQLEKDRDMLRQSTEMLHRICGSRFKELQKKEKDLVVSEEKIVEIKHLVAEKRKEIDKEKHRKEELEQQMKDLRVDHDVSRSLCCRQAGRQQMRE